MSNNFADDYMDDDTEDRYQILAMRLDTNRNRSYDKRAGRKTNGDSVNDKARWKALGANSN
jgi:hypothetical protein